MHAPLLLWRQATRDRDIEVTVFESNAKHIVKVNKTDTVDYVRDQIVPLIGKNKEEFIIMSGNRGLEAGDALTWKDTRLRTKNKLHPRRARPAPGPLVPWRRWVAPVLPWPNRPYGLSNLGNTCYLNAAVQILRRMKINGFQPRFPEH